MNKKILLIAVALLLLLSVSAVSAAQITAAPGDSFAYYGPDTPAGSTHSFAIEVDSKVYYIPDSVADKLASYSNIFRQVYNYDLQKYSNMFRPDAISYGSNGFNAYYQLNNQKDTEMFTFDNDVTFKFDYKSGQTVGYNKDAYVVTKVYKSSGDEITDTLY